ncbi:MAG: hypothetical protein GWN01_05275 [Nitrosopumilaceae archaeon]|nr:hypothetical protein [Nitrosopumilaceae archaeon]NIU00355.1 hypothetical protein [Nitrosopumilaceae archaeon]NIU86757.1 hypothetical protein [Nitrosopumilaceae archaeon]NIV65457.1 hypothetical protein [Nitrosopumilaceae archaeon]NIX60957.1 hypothetical protein [Nitrosopumilaceae archaeon]
MKKELKQSSYGYSMVDDLFVGLPSSNLKGKWIQLVVETDGPSAIVPVGHIGPWNGGGRNHKYDDRYWQKECRPQAESGMDLQGNKTNKAGILISSELWKKLELGRKRLAKVRWQFVPHPRGKKVIIAKNEKRLHLHN